MAKMTIKGLDEYALALSRLEKSNLDISKKAIYGAAGIVADKIRANLESIPIEKSRYATEKNKLNGVTVKQKKDLANGLGISPISKSEDDNFINVKIGFDGYGSTKTKKFPNGVPNVLLARSIESGASFRNKKPFVRTAVNSVRKEAVTLMGNIIEQEIKKEMK